jgi:hypothetical protein
VREPARVLVGWYVNPEDEHELGGQTITTRDGVLDIWTTPELPAGWDA